MFYVNEFKGDILTMFESVKKDIASMLDATEWSKKNFTISVNVDGKPDTLNFMLLYIIMRHMFCIDLLNSLIISGGNELVNAKSIKYLHASLQATLQLMFINITPKKMVKQQNLLFGEKAGKIWDIKNKDIIWGQSDYDTHENSQKKSMSKKRI